MLYTFRNKKAHDRYLGCTPWIDFIDLLDALTWQKLLNSLQNEIDKKKFIEILEIFICVKCHTAVLLRCGCVITLKIDFDNLSNTIFSKNGRAILCSSTMSN